MSKPKITPKPLDRPKLDHTLNTVPFWLAIEALEALKKEVFVPAISLKNSTFYDTVATFRDIENKEVAKVNFKLKQITFKKQKIVFDWEYVTLTKLKDEGWKESDLVDFLGLPLEAKNPHYKSGPHPMKLWPRHWVDKSAQ